MELKPGYKQTEVGAIPEDWEAALLGMHFSFKNGLNKSKEFFGYGTPIVNYMDVYGQSSIRAHDLQGRVDVSKQELESFGVRQGDVFFTRTSETVDEVGIASVLIEHSPNTVFSGFVLRARPKDTALADRFKIYCFSSRVVRRQITSKSSYTTRALTNGRVLSGVILPYPPTRDEQETIAEVLSDADAFIELLDQLIAKKRHVKQGTMQELLTGRKRLPGCIGEWEVKSLGEVGESLIGLTYRPGDVRPDGVLVLRSSNVQGGALRFEDNVFVEADIQERIMVRPGDILICVRNGSRDLIGKCAKVDESAKGMTFGAFMAVFRSPFHNIVFHQFQSDVIKRQICEHLGATINQITNKSLNSFRIPFPKDEAERTAIATILSDMDAEIAALEAKLVKFRQIKQAMVRCLLTGEIRLIGPVVAKAAVLASSAEESAGSHATQKPRSRAFEDAVIISALADLFGSPKFPLGRMRSTKLSYLIHRKAGDDLEGYLKKAAGPYNPKTKYAGAEAIAQKKKYVRHHKAVGFDGLVADKNVQEAKDYFTKWYPGMTAWVEQFHYKKNEELECLATVDMAMRDILSQGGTASLDSVRALIASEPEWRPKLERTAFSDPEIVAAIAKCQELFP